MSTNQLNVVNNGWPPGNQDQELIKNAFSLLALVGTISVQKTAADVSSKCAGSSARPEVPSVGVPCNGEVSIVHSQSPNNEILKNNCSNILF